MGKPSDNYAKITKNMDDSTPIWATYKKDGIRRELCPHVLGYKTKKKPADITEDDERVLCWQLVGPLPIPRYRSFDVSKLDIELKDPPQGDWVDPQADLNWDNTVKDKKKIK